MTQPYIVWRELEWVRAFSILIIGLKSVSRFYRQSLRDDLVGLMRTNQLSKICCIIHHLLAHHRSRRLCRRRSRLDLSRRPIYASY